MLWTGFSLRLSQYFLCIELFFYSDESLRPCHWKTAPQHEAATSTLYFWVGTLQVMSSAWFPSNMMLRILTVWGSFRCIFCKFQVFSCVFTEEKIEFGHTAIKPRSVECCSDVCPSVSFSHLHIWSWSSTRVTISFLVTSPTKALLHQLLSLARRPALGRILVISNFFY